MHSVSYSSLWKGTLRITGCAWHCAQGQQSMPALLLGCQVPHSSLSCYRELSGGQGAIFHLLLFLCEMFAL